MKKPRSYRMTEEAQAMLAELAKADGLSQAAVIETLIRRETKRRKIRAMSLLSAVSKNS